MRPSADFRVAEAEAAVAGPAYTVHTADNTATLPGTPVRSADQAEPSGDVAVDEAWVGIEASLALFREVYGRDSFDGAGAFVSATVHYEKDYDNAFWDGTQLVFGDGDGQVFDRFTKPVDVLGHEFTHAVTERTAGLVYEGQSGALNESVSDVFATCMKQRLLGQTADQGDWLIGAGLFLPGINGRALRSMSAPGTAYDDPALGKDPQPADMSGYIETTDDNGGVHLNSGIPNRAFHLAATAIGGSSAEGAGRIWYAALGAVEEDVDFAGFAAACVAAAGAACRRGARRLDRGGGAGWRWRLRPLRLLRRSGPAGSSRCGAPAASSAAPSPARSTSTATTRGPARCATWSTGSTWPRSPRAGCTRTRSSTTSWWAVGPPGSWAPTCPTTSAGWPSCCSATIADRARRPPYSTSPRAPVAVSRPSMGCRRMPGRRNVPRVYRAGSGRSRATAHTAVVHARTPRRRCPLG